MHIIVNGNIETKTLSVERSHDAINFEAIGNITLIGTPALFDLVYYFIDEVPGIGNVYYRISGNFYNNELVYTEIINIISKSKNNVFDNDVLANENNALK